MSAQAHMTCAICTSSTGPFHHEPLGRGGAAVAVCAACATEVPDANVHERRNAYAGGGESGAAALTTTTMTKAMRKLMGDAEYDRTTALAVRHGLAPSATLPKAEVDLRAMAHDGARRIRSGAAHGQSPSSLRNERARRQRKIGRTK